MTVNCIPTATVIKDVRIANCVYCPAYAYSNPPNGYPTEMNKNIFIKTIFIQGPFLCQVTNVDYSVTLARPYVRPSHFG